jgi:hypothetical protein
VGRVAPLDSSRHGPELLKATFTTDRVVSVAVQAGSTRRYRGRVVESHAGRWNGRRRPVKSDCARGRAEEAHQRRYQQHADHRDVTCCIDVPNMPQRVRKWAMRSVQLLMSSTDVDTCSAEPGISS